MWIVAVKCDRIRWSSAVGFLVKCRQIVGQVYQILQGAYRVAWRKAGSTDRWLHRDVYALESGASVRTWPLDPGTYEVRLYVKPPRSGDRAPGDADLAFAATVAAPGAQETQEAPPEITSAGPALEWARVNGAELALRFDAALDESSVPAGSAFAVSAAGAARAVSAVAVSRETVTLTLAQAVPPGAAVTLGYAPPAAGMLRAAGGGAGVAAFSGVAVANDTGSRQRQAGLAARVADAPAAHRGRGTFTVKVAFSDAVRGTAKAAEGTVRVAGGTLVRARRDGGADRWALDVRPSSRAAVTLTLPATEDCAARGAVCTADGRRLLVPLVHTVPGPVTLSVADARATEGEDATIDFAVSLSRAAPGPVTVRYRTRSGTAKAGRDFAAARGTLTFAAGETERTVPVAVIDDAHDEGEEAFTLLLSGKRHFKPIPLRRFPPGDFHVQCLPRS